MSPHWAVVAGGLGHDAGPTTHGNRSLAAAERALPKNPALTPPPVRANSISRRSHWARRARGASRDRTCALPEAGRSGLRLGFIRPRQRLVL